MKIYHLNNEVKRREVLYSHLIGGSLSIMMKHPISSIQTHCYPQQVEREISLGGVLDVFDSIPAPINTSL